MKNEIVRSAALIPLFLCVATHAGADVKEALEAAVASEVRSEEERARDANRKPVDTLLFFGLEQDERVLELLPGGGWYTKILAPVLREKGVLYVYAGARDRVTPLRDSHEELARVEVLDAEVPISPTAHPGIFEVGSFEFPVRDLDLVLTFRNMHNFTESGRKHLYEAIFASLAPGGRLGVVDHTRRHMAPHTDEVWRRMDPVLAIQEAQAVGFELVAHSDLHYRPDDELRYEVQRKSVAGNSDRFTLLFRKAR